MERGRVRKNKFIATAFIFTTNSKIVALIIFLRTSTLNMF